MQKEGALAVCPWAKPCHRRGGVQVHRCPPVLNFQCTFLFDPLGPQEAAALFSLATRYGSAPAMAVLPLTSIME